uniref:Uncharacterized protein n=1 Tax=Octopus bimaculoides TaxID=37653 RepID=A0A0L8GAM5_OCTBM
MSAKNFSISFLSTISTFFFLFKNDLNITVFLSVSFVTSLFIRSLYILNSCILKFIPSFLTLVTSSKPLPLFKLVSPPFFAGSFSILIKHLSNSSSDESLSDILILSYCILNVKQHLPLQTKGTTTTVTLARENRVFFKNTITVQECNAHKTTSNLVILLKHYVQLESEENESQVVHN